LLLIWDNLKKQPPIPNFTDASMIAPNNKRLSLPFSHPKTKTSQTEAAAVFAVAELTRGRGGGIFNRQPQETLLFITKAGYPLWVYPKNQNSALVFDGLDCHSHSVNYTEAPSATSFLGNLQKAQAPRDSYMAFLCSQETYFQQPPQQKQFLFRGLIENTDFRNDFSIYRRETTELTDPLALLPPILEESIINLTLQTLEKTLATLAADDGKLAEVQKILKKATGQYLTEIEFDATAAKEEADAKIKATQEFVGLEVTKITREYNRKMKILANSYDEKLENFEKERNKTGKVIASTESDIREYERNAKEASKKGHEVYEKRWKEKAKAQDKVLSGYKKDLKAIEANINKLVRQKAADLGKLNGELETAVKKAQQPLEDLVVARDARLFAYKQESNRLIACEKPVAEGIDGSLKLREEVSEIFAGFILTPEQVKDAVLIYVPFYVVCYLSGSSKRYLYISPSSVGEFDFSAKLRDALGRSKTYEMLIPRYQAITTLMAKAKTLTQENRLFENQLFELGNENNLLKNIAFTQAAKTGLTLLQQAGWLSERETTELSNKLTA
jgi:hypothetical protein